MKLKERTVMYFDGTTLTTLLSDAEKAAAHAPAIAAAGPRYTSTLAVIEAAIELPDLGEAGVKTFLDAQGIELRDIPPGPRLIAGALATQGKLRHRLHAACAAYYETDVFVFPAGEPVAPPTE
jgi:ribonuclease VapC